MNDDERKAQGEGAVLKEGFQPAFSAALDARKALDAALGSLGYGLVYGAVRDSVLVLKTGLSDKYDATEWSNIAKIVARALLSSEDPRVRSFLEKNEVKQVAIAAAP